MSIVLASAWKPRGEVNRFFESYPLLMHLYSKIFISVPSDCPTDFHKKLNQLSGVKVIQPLNWSEGRHAVIFTASNDENPFVHYVDFDRLLRWIELVPEEFPEVIEEIQRSDCLIIGRSTSALATHAQALQQTEHITNRIFSHFLGQTVDLGGGSRGFSKQAINFLKKNSYPDNAIGTDSSWPILLHRAGFSIKTKLVNGLTWEVPDHYKMHSVEGEEHTSFTQKYDNDASRWELRVITAGEILEAGLYALNQVIET